MKTLAIVLFTIAGALVSMGMIYGGLELSGTIRERRGAPGFGMIVAGFGFGLMSIVAYTVMEMMK